MAGKRIVIPNYMPALDIDGNPVAGAKLYFYENGTTTLATVYTSAALNVAHPNPVVANAAGVFASIFADEAEEFSVAITDSDGSPISGLRNRDKVKPSLVYGQEAAESAADTVFVQTGVAATTEALQIAVRRLGAFPEQYGAAGNGVTDDTAAIQACLDANLHVIMRGDYLISAALTLRDDHLVEISGLVEQSSQTANAFTATTKSRVSIWLNGGEIRGSGGWNPGSAWSGNQGHEARRLVRFIGCTDCVIYGKGKVTNFGNAGVDITGGSGCEVRDIEIIGPHAYDETIPADGNFCNGVYICNDATHGTANGTRVERVTISAVAQGILRELPTDSNPPTEFSYVVNCRFRDIPGQHALYNMASFLYCEGNVGTNINTSLMKHQASRAAYTAEMITCVGNTGHDCGGSIYEIAAINGAFMRDVRLDGQGQQVGYLLSLNGPISGIEADVSGSDAVTAATIRGNGLSGTVRVNARRIDQIGILVTATGSTVNLYPTLTDVNLSNGGTTTGDAIRVTTDDANTDATTVNIFSPRLTDPNGYMTYGLRIGRTQSTVNIYGDAEITGFNNGQSIVTAGTLNGLYAALGEWDTYTPTITASSGTLTTVTTNRARYWRKGKKVTALVDFTITDAGTGTNNLLVTLPVNAAGGSAGSATEYQSTGAIMRNHILPSVLTQMNIQDATGSNPIGTGRKFLAQITYEAAS